MKENINDCTPETESMCIFEKEKKNDCTNCTYRKSFFNEGKKKKSSCYSCIHKKVCYIPRDFEREIANQEFFKTRDYISLNVIEIYVFSRIARVCEDFEEKKSEGKS